jgi:DNA-binding transcriptional ArsR family regulator
MLRSEALSPRAEPRPRVPLLLRRSLETTVAFAPHRDQTSPADAILHALSVALRRDIFQRIASREAITPKDIAQDLGLPLPSVSYHVKVLATAGLIEITRTEPRRGAVAHFYRRVPKRTKQVDALLADIKRLR